MSKPHAASAAASTDESAGMGGGALFGLLVVQFAFASFPVAGKLAFTGFDPMAVATWRVFFTAAVFLPVVFYFHGRKAWLAPRDFAALFGLSLLGATLNQVLFIKGLRLSSATNAGLIMAFIPPATYAFAVLLKKEQMRPRKILGVFAATVGVALLFFDRGADLGGESLKGDIMMLINASAYSLYMVLARPMLSRISPLIVTFWIFVFAAMIVPWLSLDVAWVPESATRNEWLALAWILVFPSALAYFLNTWALRRVEASVVGIFVCLQPLISISGAVLILKEALRPVVFGTAPLVLLGVWLVSRRRQLKPDGLSRPDPRG